MKLDDQVAIVVGAARGIGAGIKNFRASVKDGEKSE